MMGPLGLEKRLCKSRKLRGKSKDLERVSLTHRRGPFHYVTLFPRLSYAPKPTHYGKPRLYRDRVSNLSDGPIPCIYVDWVKILRAG